MRINIIASVIISLFLVSCKKDGVTPVDSGNNVPIVFNVRASVQVGDVVYDSIPAQLHIRSWNSGGQVFEKDLQLAAGTNSVSLPSSFQKNELTLTKWGVSDSKLFVNGSLTDGMQVVIGGIRTAKKIKTVSEAKETASGFTDAYKTDYEYNTAGKIHRIKYYEKDPTGFWSLEAVQKIEHENGRVVRTTDEFFNGADPIVTEFYYDAVGRVEGMLQKVNGIDISAGVDHIFQTKQMINIDYLYSNGKFNTYTMEFKSGNVIQDLAVQDFNSSSLRKYEYDLHINPFIHLKLPNFFLSNENKNNRVKESHTYTGSFPTAIPYEYNYQYNSEGYPVEALVKYRSAINGNLQASRKRQYIYY